MPTTSPAFAAPTIPDPRAVGTEARIEMATCFYGLGTSPRLVGPDVALLYTWEPDPRGHDFRFEAAEVPGAVTAGRATSWSLPWDATRRFMGLMDEVRDQVGVLCPGEDG